MRRITKSEIHGMMKRLCRSLGQDLTLDYNAVYGGYKIEGKQGYYPIGEKRLSASEFYTAVHMCCCAIELYKEGIKNE